MRTELGTYTIEFEWEDLAPRPLTDEELIYIRIAPFGRRRAWPPGPHRRFHGAICFRPVVYLHRRTFAVFLRNLERF